MNTLISIKDAAKALDCYPKKLAGYCKRHGVELFETRRKLFVKLDDLNSIDTRLIKKKGQAYITIRINKEDIPTFRTLSPEQIVAALERPPIIAPYALKEKQARVNITIPKDVKENSWENGRGVEIIRTLIVRAKQNGR